MIRLPLLLRCLASIAIGLARIDSFAAPEVSALEPLAVRVGTPTLLTVHGEAIGGDATLWTSFPCQIATVSSNGTTMFQLLLPGGTRTGVGAVRLVTTNGLSGLQLLLIDSLPVFAAAGKNHTAATATLLPRDNATDGTCEALHSDFFRIRARKGERITIEAVAQRIGSALDPFLRLLDSEGREIAFNDDTPGLGVDARIDTRCPRTGDYLIELRDTRHAGGPKHRYRLRFGRELPVPLPFVSAESLARRTGTTTSLPLVAEKEPNDAPDRPHLITLPAELRGGFEKAGDRDVFEFPVRTGQRLVFSGATRSLGSPCDVFLQLQTTNGTRIAEANANNADEGALTNRFSADGFCRLVVDELTGAGGPALSYRIAIREWQPGFTLSTETERVSGPAGESFEIEVKAERAEYDGAIELAVEGLPPTFTLSSQVMAANTNTARLKILVPAGEPLGALHQFGIIGRAMIGGAPVRERVSTRPALRNALPALRHPPGELDGLLMFSVSESRSTSPKPPEKKRRK